MSTTAAAGKVRRTTSGTVLSVQDLRVRFETEDGPVFALSRHLRRINLDLRRG